jgi:hypothetical protein
METRPRTRLLRRALVVAALGALVVPATADAAKKTKLPAITNVTPKNVSVGETLVINGKNFRVGKAKNTVMFKRDGGKALFIKSGLATKRQIAVVIPKSLEKYMATTAGKPVATRFRLRVLTTKLAKRFTAVTTSPVIGPERPTVTAPPVAPDGDCDGDGALNRDDADDDNDLLGDAQEIALKLNPCSGDSDGDIDYDGDGLDLATEYHLWKYSYEVNHSATRTLTPLSYTDGAQYSLSQLAGGNGMRQPTMTVGNYQPPQSFRNWANVTGYGTVQLYSRDITHTRSPYDLYDMNLDGTVTSVATGHQRRPEATYWDDDGNGLVSDDERDEDGDGLSNYYEIGGPLSSADWWSACYPEDGAYPIKYVGTQPDDADTDGDGILDGADDQDFDDVPNIMEVSRNMAGNWPRNAGCGTGGTTDPSAPAGSYVNPFNPCLPDPDSRTCPRHPIIGQAYAPFIKDWKPLISN